MHISVLRACEWGGSAPATQSLYLLTTVAHSCLRRAGQIKCTRRCSFDLRCGRITFSWYRNTLRRTFAGKKNIVSNGTRISDRKKKFGLSNYWNELSDFMMSAVVATEGLFFSALQPSTSVTTYAIPTGDHPRRDQLSKARRVQQQVQQRMAEKSSSSSRLNASTGEQNLLMILCSLKLRQHVLCSRMCT